jgi:hypothetical protein
VPKNKVKVVSSFLRRNLAAHRKTAKWSAAHFLAPLCSSDVIISRARLPSGIISIELLLKPPVAEVAT